MPTDLTPERSEIAAAVVSAYMRAGPLSDGRTPFEWVTRHDKRRVDLIDKSLRPLVENYLAGKVPLSDFKRQIDSLNKQNNLWGFTGTKGQMFFNMLLKTTDDPRELDDELRNVLRAPSTDATAAAQLVEFKRFVERVGTQFGAAGGSAYSKPKPGSVAFFASYFWQIQQRDRWPVYYTNTVQVLEDLNLWSETGDVGVDYVSYVRLHETLRKSFSGVTGRAFGLYDVEHVFWWKSGRLDADTAAPAPAPEAATPRRSETAKAADGPKHTDAPAVLPDSYLPPIVEMLPRLARNDSDLQAAAGRSGTSLPRAFEKSINAAFSMLGFETQLLGQGKGRVQDGQAVAPDEQYAVLWDAKIRADGYNMGTDDRTIRQYIDSQSRALKKSRSLRNIYYLIISSSFKDDFDDLIRSLKMETDVNEVCLMEATALAKLVEQKLRAPREISLGPDGVQRLFSSSGLIGEAKISDLI